MALATPVAAAPPVLACEVTGPVPAPERDPVCVRADKIETDLCSAIEQVSERHALSPDFYARLIWQESLFDPAAVSPKGALGVAQFMPGTARLRGLRDPFNPADALAKSAAYVAELIDRFGNPGLAAAAYNAGERRVEDLLSRNRGMPAETEGYVEIITGKTIAAWKAGLKEPADFTLDPAAPFQTACVALARSRDLKRQLARSVNWKPWGVQLGFHNSRGHAHRLFRTLKQRYPSLLGGEEALVVPDRRLSRGNRVRFALRVGRDSWKSAYLLCGRLRALGGSCTLARN